MIVLPLSLSKHLFFCEFYNLAFKAKYELMVSIAPQLNYVRFEYLILGSRAADFQFHW